MKSQSLKFFPRESKLSNQEELLLSDFNISNKDKVANQRLECFAVYMLLLMKMSEDDNAGYFLEYNQDNKNLLANKIGTDNKFLNRVVFRCIERGLFDKAMFQKYNILTSADIQDKYFFGKQRCSKIRVVVDYLYDFVYTNFENVFKKAIFVNKNGEIVNKKTQTTLDNTDTDTDTNTETNTQSTFENFSSLFPNKIDMSLKDIPPFVNLETLTEKLKESEFLQKCNNLTMHWFCQENNYKKIISDFYKGMSFNNNKPYQTRSYTQEELDSLYTNLDDINL